ncbi:unnamed protein product [Lota lota]
MDRNKRRLQSQLCKAVKDEDPRSVQVLLSQGASANEVGNKGVAAVHLAVGKETEKSIRCLKLLLQHGADPNVRSSEGLTPLHVAALWGCYQNVKLLLVNGGNPNVTDQEGNTPGQFAEQQDNRKCAQLLQNHQAQSADPEEDRHRFQYSIYSDQTNVSGYPDSDTSLGSRSSVISDCGEDLLSSTRHSALFDRRVSNHRNPRCRGGPLNRHGGPSLLSSTRMSMAGPVAPNGPVANNNVEAPVRWGKSHPLGLECRLSVLDRDAPTATVAGPSRRASRKSVSFREVAEYFPALRPESPEPPGDTVPSDSSEDLDFVNSERLVTVLHRQGIDVTSPDHVHVFDWDCSRNTEADMEKTVISNFHLEGGEETDDDEEEEEEEEVGRQTRAPEQPPGSVAGGGGGGGGGSSSSGSHYSSCDSDHYTTAHYTTAHGGLVPASRSASSEEEAREGALKSDAQHPTADALRSQDVQILAQQSEQEAESKLDRLEDVPAQVGELTPSDRSPATDSEPEPCWDLSEKVGNTANEDDDADDADDDDDDDDVGGEATTQARCRPVGRMAGGSQEDPDLHFTPSPFVTGRTRSRLSRCPMKTSQTLESLFSDASLFEETLPTPVRTCRRAPRSQSSDDVFYNSPRARGYAPTPPPPPPRRTGDGSRDLSGSSLTSESRSSSGVSDSQADTFILPRGGAEAGPPSPSSPDALIILERKPDSPTLPPREGHLRDFAPELAGHDTTDDEGGFLTDGRTSSDTVNPRAAAAAGTERLEVPKDNEVSRITEGSDTDAEPGSSSSSSSRHSSPRRAREVSSETPCAPGTTGCTPRFSMSRLSLGVRRPQSHLAPRNDPQTYTPGGRPAALDLEAPVEYLYTDREQGHELIETHIPPMANTSVSSTSSGDPPADETVLYDWRSLRADVTGGKENQAPRRRVEEEEATAAAAAQLQKKKTKTKKEEKLEEEEKRKREQEVKGCSVLPETMGLTDKELRRRLLELGESPGPISTRTRPVYMRRLRRLVLESNTQAPQQPHKQPDQSHADSGYSLELSRALRTFNLPDCHAAEMEVCQQFDQPDQNKKWREGVIKSSFNYLLLDPRVTKNLPYRSRTMSPHECFQTFAHAVFYVGKGKRSRPYSHLYEALEYFKGDKTSKKLCSKVQHILQVWNGGQGVISLHCFQNVIPVEAFTREACMVDAIGLKMLTNQKRGDYYGVVSTWQARKRRELGVHLLYRAMQIFLAEGERQLRPADIRQ